MKLEDYLYDLPQDKIAQFPLKDRSASKLLRYQNGSVTHHLFRDLPNLLPQNSLLVFNNTKVIPARLFFTKPTGALIEIFLLEPLKPHKQRELAMEAKSPVQWLCMIRNLRKWKDDPLILQYDEKNFLSAKLIDREQQLVEFSWSPSDATFSEVLEKCGKIPLPPYMHREATKEDVLNYQTIYAVQKGAVAAPTAGLHFTPAVLKSLKEKNIATEYLTLHVSAGTFQPIKAEDVREHEMHEEEISITRDNILKLLKHPGPVISVGTTSMRSMESLYWYGVKLLEGTGTEFFIEKLTPYQQHNDLPDKEAALTAVLRHFEANQLEMISGKTEIFIFPGYTFRICDGLITNFHLPGSTLILLVAALIGEDWREIYEEALSNNYRFLSYGDSSLLLP
jgi:S-adenosylmethionine:tRNA ribosyltransferase-isomerase